MNAKLTSATTINEAAFYNCKSLRSIELPNNLVSISDRAFFNCYKLVEVINKSPNITVTKGSSDNGYLGYYALSVSNCDDTYTSKLSTDENGFVILYTEEQDKVLVDHNGIETNLIIPNGITRINDYAFYNCTSITSITIPDSVSSIGKYAFQNCTAQINWGDNPTIKTIESYSFYGYKGASIIIPDSVTSIDEYAFSYCSSLTSIIIPNSVTTINYCAFDNCSLLATIYCEAESKPSGWLDDSGSGNAWGSSLGRQFSWLGNCNAQVFWGYKG